MTENRQRASLRWQLFVRLALLVLALIPMFGIVRYYFSENALTAEFKAKREGAAEVLAVSLREPLWDLDDFQVAEAVSAFSYMKELQAVKITETGASSYERVYLRMHPESPLEPAQSVIRTAIEANVQQPFKVMFRDAELANGVLYFSNDEFETRLRETMIELVIQMVLFSFIVLALIYLLLERFVGTPLMRLKKAVATGAEPDALANVTEQLPDNEIRTFAEHYSRVLNDLRNHQQHLTEMVLQRTRALSDSNEQLAAEIEQRSRMEQDLIAARQQAEQASEAKTYFLAHMSHELRTPLNGIIGYSQLLSQGTDSVQEMNEYVTNIGRCADHLLELINRILDLSKIEHGRMDVLVAPFALHRLLDDVVAVIQPRADSRHLALNQHRDEDVPAVVEGDAAKLRQVLINLLGNAVKFTEHGSITLEVRWLGEDIIEFAVRDTGVGISSRDMERIFEPFQQAGTLPQQWRQEGTGLGLSISRRLVQMMGGELIADSQEGKGSHFRFRIKMPASHLDLPAMDANSAVTLADGQSFKVMVVDDVSHNRDALTKQLMRMGFDVRAVDSGPAALDAMQQQPADLVFMDIRMPGMDGITCAREMRKRYADVRILAYTASVFDAEVNSEILSNFDDLILKPVDIGQVVGTLSKNLPVRFVSKTNRPSATVAPESGSVSQLTEAERAHLSSWLASGALTRIREFADGLRKETGDKAQLGETLYRLARAYDIEGLRRLLQVSDANES
ncbi:ATP-binding protein [Permianibacter aggregans]|uniref:histidine kinase n=1 Tax=Permianibacter aggregans TaxID=1510150 RepID=A0A4R6ULJ3_9GAMM|nr:ATP-binding protein [Permianibacter aggregans]QGX40255.1 response regulator [Permianibacter aggregans]TDQ47512.1 signal transduction histidine kinase [Permianibacter aggregans]